MEPVRITATSGRVEVTAEARADVAVDRGQEHPMGGLLEVKGTSSGVVVRVPTGADVTIGTHSGPVETHGELGAVRVTTRSGSVRVDRCRELDARTVSGKIAVTDVTGDARIRAASGRITVGRVGGDLGVTSVSGKVEVGDAAGAVHATTVQGRVDVCLSGDGPARCESVSGRVCVSVPEGVHPQTSLRTMSGRCDCEVPEGDGPEIVGRTVSGRITVRAHD